ncbi:MAG: histidine phosphatase family protein [Lachnospiraceae bacterium]|nr:histidine phosphatase family protein [Lachnospiraceae bacterium]
MEIYLIRHGKTKGNGEGRYIGSTDEPLSELGRRELTETLWKGGYGKAGLKKPQAVYVSGLLRTGETARLLFPGEPLTVREGLNECDFGAFENRNYEELKEEPAYTDWIESGGVLAPPGGEAKADFAARTIRAFEGIVAEQLSGCGGELSETDSRAGKAGQASFRAPDGQALAFVVHGGSIMALLEHYGFPRQGFYHWQVKNGCGYQALLSEADWLSGERYLTEIRSIP